MKNRSFSALMVLVSLAVMVACTLLATCRASRAADPQPVVQPAANPDVYNATFDGWSVKLKLVDGLYEGSGLANNGDTLVVVYNPWWNVVGLDLTKPADVARLGDRLIIRRTRQQVLSQWEYDGPALAGFSLEFPGLDGATYPCSPVLPGMPAAKVDCVITRIP